MRVLIVDDEKTCAETLEHCLSRNGHQVHTATNGFEALSQITRLHPDVVLSNMAMPRMGGFELLEAIQERFPHIPVILMSNHVQRKNTMQALPEGVYGILHKPFKLKKLYAMLIQIEEQQAPNLAKQRPELRSRAAEQRLNGEQATPVSEKMNPCRWRKK
jgi:DNA-binding NtrC family response regulator